MFRLEITSEGNSICTHVAEILIQFHIIWGIEYLVVRNGLSVHFELHLLRCTDATLSSHDDVIKWKHFPHYWPFVRGSRRSPVNSTHKGQWCGALMISLICAWINGWVNNREAGDLRRQHAHYDVSVVSTLRCNYHSYMYICRENASLQVFATELLWFYNYSTALIESTLDHCYNMIRVTKYYTEHGTDKDQHVKFETFKGHQISRPQTIAHLFRIRCSQITRNILSS